MQPLAVIWAHLRPMIAHKTPVEINILRVELFLGVFIGAITFTGSIIAYGKLAGRVDSKATKLPGGHTAQHRSRRNRGDHAGLVL